ncbi:unnamed protein product [Coregonus sp. 'balchen']|nr:unnamed protein product [Coregonus sp. 'balchen']
MLGSFVLLWICICLLLFFFLKFNRPQNFPPGPQPIPIFGNLLHLSLGNPMKDLEKEALVTRAADFAGRPQDLMVNHVTEGKGVILMDYGSSWKEHRRFALMTLKNFGLGKQSMEERILGEISHIIAPLAKSVGKSMNPQVLFHNAASNIICLVLFGSRYDYNDEFLKTFVKLYTENAKIANGPWAMKAFQNAICCKQMSLGLVTQHKETRIPGEPRDFIDCYLDELEKRGDDGSSFSEAQLIMYILDLHFAGTDTTSNTLLTAFLYLMTHPEIQGLFALFSNADIEKVSFYYYSCSSCRLFLKKKERCQQEIDTVLEGKEHASFEDRHRMPYTQAGTLIIPNLTSVLSEEGQWKYPHDFNPLNFLNEQGEFTKPEAFMPFSAGPRMCLGEGLARMELFLIMVTLLRRFKFVWPEDAGEPDYTPVFGVTLSPKPYRLGVRLRGN